MKKIRIIDWRKWKYLGQLPAGHPVEVKIHAVMFYPGRYINLFKFDVVLRNYLIINKIEYEITEDEFSINS